MGQLGKMDVRDPVGNGVEQVRLHMLQLAAAHAYGPQQCISREGESCIWRTALRERVRATDSCVMELLLRGAGMGIASYSWSLHSCPPIPSEPFSLEG